MKTPIGDDRRRRRLGALAAVLGLLPASALAGDAGWVSLINYRDFSGWETWEGIPLNSYDVPGLARDADGYYSKPIGLNRDPLHVFSYVTIKGTPALRISGQVRGALTTLKAHGNYRLRAKFKWGDARWEGESYPRNTGILYHAFGAQGGFGGDTGRPGAYMKSIEFEFQATGLGDFIALGGISGMVRAELKDNPQYSPTNSWRYVYSPSSQPMEFSDIAGTPAAAANGRRVHRAVDPAKPKGEWNTVELICFGDKSVQIVNGQITANASALRFKSSPDAPLAPLTKGRIQIQSEGAEVFFSSIEIMPLDREPPEMAGM